MALTPEQQVLQQMKQKSLQKAPMPGAMAQTQSPFIQANPIMEGHLSSMLQQGAANPISAPVAAGTPTQRRVEADAAQSRWEQEFAANERHRAAQLAQQRASAKKPQIQQISSMIKEMTDAAARSGNTFSDVMQALQSPGALGALQESGVSMDQAMELAKQYYGSTLQPGRFAGDVNAPLSKNMMVPSQPSLRDAVKNMGGFDFEQSRAKQSALDKALQNFQQFSPQPAPREIKPGLYEDPVTGKRFTVNQWGQIVNEGDPGWGTISGLSGIKQ